MVCAHCSASACLPKFVYQSLSTKACLPKLVYQSCAPHTYHVQLVHHCTSQCTLHHETDSIPRHTAGIHAHAGCCQACLCSSHQLGLASNVPPTCHNGTAWVLDQAAHAQVSPHLRQRSNNNNHNNNNDDDADDDGNENDDNDNDDDNVNDNDNDNNTFQQMLHVCGTSLVLPRWLVLGGPQE